MARFNSSESDGVSKVGIGDGIGESNTFDVYKSNYLCDDLLDDLDSYWEDINVRLTISRMVSDSIIKGMVSAISQEATAKITAKELEVVNSKGILQYHHFQDSAYEPHDELQKYHRESLNVLNQDVEEQLQRLEKCIANAKEPNFREIVSTPEIIQLDENLEESLIIKNDFVEAFYCLKDSLKTMRQQVDVIACSQESFVKEWKVELDIHKEVETMVFCAVVQDLRCTFENKLWDVNNVLALIENLNEISTLRDELHSFYKYFVGLENGNCFPQGSIEADHFHRKFYSNHGLSSTQIFDANGKCEESKNNMSENLPCRLNHMSTEELYQHFRTVITEMKREHESAVQVMTEENFTLKRELLKERELVKERGPSAPIKKDKEFEVIKKKISEVIGKVDNIVFENEKLSEFCNHSKETLDNLLWENYQLKDLLNKQKLELQTLSMKASDAAERLLHHSWAEENLHKLVGDLKLDLQDQHIEASISKEVFKCMLKEMAALINVSCEDLDLKSMIMQDIIGTIYEEVFHSVDFASKLDSDGNSVLQSSIMHQMYIIVLQEALKDMSMKFNKLKDNLLKEDEGSSFFQRKLSEIENELAIKLEENNKLKNNILVLENSIEEKKKLLVEHTTLHETEKAEFSKELNNIACLRTRQEALISERNKEILLLKDKLGGSQKELDFYMFEVDKLGKALELSKLELRKSDEEKASVRSILEKEQCYLASIKVKNSEHSKHMGSLCDVIQDLSNSFADFELTVKESIGWNSVRLDNLAFQLHSLVPKVNVLRRTGSLYKERLEKKCLDLQKAEVEVDLLGDEVDNLLSLLEKIYVALDHYSPILQHYPGIIEIIKLVKRELGGVAVKAG